MEKGGYVHFYKDSNGSLKSKSYNSDGKENDDDGTISILQNEKKIIVTYKSGGKTESDIVELTKDSFIFSKIDEGHKDTRYFIPLSSDKKCDNQ